MYTCAEQHAKHYALVRTAGPRRHTAPRRHGATARRYWWAGSSASRAQGLYTAEQGPWAHHRDGGWLTITPSGLLVGRQQCLEVLEEVDRGGGLLVVIFLDAAVQVDL